jgi:putative alpha-1,2-mannosidase
MKSFTHLLLLTQCATPVLSEITSRQTTDSDVLKWVNTLIGSQNGGNVFAGATLPYGMAKGSSQSADDWLYVLIIIQLSQM